MGPVTGLGQCGGARQRVATPTEEARAQNEPDRSLLSFAQRVCLSDDGHHRAKNKKQKPFAKSPIKINVLSVNNLTLCYLLGRLADNSQSLDAAVQHSQKVLQSLAGVTGEETNGRESGRTSQLPVQLLPLLLGQQVRFIQHQQNPVWRRDAAESHDPCLLRSENFFFLMEWKKLRNWVSLGFSL